MNHINKKNNVDDDALSSTKPHVLRVADILLQDQEEDSNLTGMEQRRNREQQLTIVQCSTTPQRIISRWFSALKSGSVKTKFRKQQSQLIKSTTVKTDGNDVGASSAGGRCGGKDSFNLGVACGLLYVIAAGKNELNKMVEMRKQMEMILDDAKNDMNKKPMEYSSNIDNNNNNLVSFSTDFQRGPMSSSGSQFSLQSVVGVVADDEEEEGQETTGVMDQLEAELQTELERLEMLHLEDSETDSKSPHHQTIKDDDDGDDEEGSWSCGEVINEGGEAELELYNDDELLWGCGVCPVELERKLHLVLEERQEARIRELEHALQCAQQKLREKEMEVSSLRDG